MLKKFIFSRRPARRSARLFKLFFISTGEMTGAPVGAKIQNFEIFKIMKMLKNDFNKITTWKSDQEEFYIMMFGISKWIHIIHRILFEFRISSLVQQFRADRRADRRGLWSSFNVVYMLYLLIYLYNLILSQIGFQKQLVK